MPNGPFSQTSLSPETRAWLAAQANEQLGEPQFSPEDVVKIPRADGKFDLFIINRNQPVGNGSVSQIYRAYPISVDGEVDRKPVAVKVMQSEGHSLDLMSSRPPPAKGCDLFLMKTPKLGKFKKSDQSHLYLYKEAGCDLYLRKTPTPPKQPEESTRTSLHLYQDAAGIFYMSGGKRFAIENPPRELIKNENAFNDTKCKIPEISNSIIQQAAAKNENIRAKEKYFYLWGGVTHYIEDTRDVTNALKTAEFNNKKCIDGSITPLVRLTYARGHTYSRTTPSEDKVLKFETSDTGLHYQMMEGTKQIKGFIPWGDDFPQTSKKTILENKDKWLPIILAKVRKEEKSELYDKRMNAVEGLDRENISLNVMGKLNDRVTTAAGDYLFMPLSPGIPMKESGSAFHQVKTLKDQLSIMAQLGEQVELLHNGGRTHGDLHPGNMLISQDSKGFHLDLIDLDQSREIKNKNEMLSPGKKVNMAQQIRAPEIMDKKVGAPSDIYALGLNFLFILGHKKPFFEVAPTSFFMANKLESPEYDAAMKAYVIEHPQATDSEKNKYGNKIQRLAENYVTKIWREQNPIVVGEFKSLPLLVDDIPIRQLVTDFLQKMLSEKAEDRPTIDEVNKFVKAFQHLMNNPTAKIVHETSLAQWKDPLPPEQLKQYHEKLLAQLPEPNKKYEAVATPDKPPPSPAVIDAQQEQYRARLAALLAGMKNIDYRINKQKGMIGRLLLNKSPDRIQLENTLKGIADLYDAASSSDPRKDYEHVKMYVVAEREKLKLSQGKDKIGALTTLLADSSKAEPPKEVLASQKENSVVQKFFHRPS